MGKKQINANDKNERMQWTGAHAATLHTLRWLRKPVYESILLISIQFSTTIRKLFRITFEFLSNRHKSKFVRGKVEQKVNLLPQNLPEDTEVAPVWNLWRIWNSHCDELAMRRVMKPKTSDHRCGIFSSLSLIIKSNLHLDSRFNKFLRLKNQAIRINHSRE